MIYPKNAGETIRAFAKPPDHPESIALQQQQPARDANNPETHRTIAARTDLGESGNLHATCRNGQLTLESPNRYRGIVVLEPTEARQLRDWLNALSL